MAPKDGREISGLTRKCLEEIFPELSESEDEKIRKEIMYHIQYCDDTIDKETEERMIAWLEKQFKALKVEEAMRNVEQKAKAFTEANKGQTSDEILAQMRGVGTDEIMLRYIGNAITCKESAKYLEEKGIDMVTAHCWLNSLKPQPKQVWSAEDEKMVVALMSICDEWAIRHSYLPKENNDMEKIKRWLKSLRPQKQWKPSKEQIDALDEVYKTHGANSACRRVLITLLNDLKKLTE